MLKISKLRNNLVSDSKYYIHNDKKGIIKKSCIINNSVSRTMTAYTLLPLNRPVELRLLLIEGKKYIGKFK